MILVLVVLHIFFLLQRQSSKLTRRLAIAVARISQIGGQISGNPTAGGREKLLEKHPDDVRSATSHPFPLFIIHAVEISYTYQILTWISQ